jgi:hypothetical protein
MKLLPGQNLRYTGRGFAGYVKGQPYMVFIAPHSVHQILVNYNGADTIVDKYLTDPV